MYCSGLGFSEIGRFQGHQGFDGVLLGEPGHGYHLEFAYCRTHPVVPTPTPEDLLVFYIDDPSEWKMACLSMVKAGFGDVAAFNPYWDQRGRTFEDHDSYRTVLVQGSWNGRKP